MQKDWETLQVLPPFLHSLLTSLPHYHTFQPTPSPSTNSLTLPTPPSPSQRTHFEVREEAVMLRKVDLDS